MTRRLTAKEIAAMDPAARTALIERVTAGLQERIAASKCKKCGSFHVHAMGLCSPCYHRDLRARARVKTILCRQCLRPFETSRRDAKTCSNACRMKVYRAGRRNAVAASCNVASDPKGPSLQMAANELETAPCASPADLSAQHGLTPHRGEIPPEFTYPRNSWTAHDYSLERFSAGTAARFFAKQTLKPQRRRAFGW
jgi:uncharacterized OB-fold protein